MRRIISFLLIFTALAANARQVTPEEAQSIASEFFNSGSTSKVKKIPRRAVQASRSAENQSEPQPYYIFNADDNAGFVIISGDTRAKKILGYSDSGSFDTDNMPPQLKVLMEQCAKAMDAIPSSQAEDDSWSSEAIQSSSEGVLLETANWGQGYPYNTKCPIIDGVQAPTGCVATAMAIVMKYHNWPEKGRSYSDFVEDGVDKHLDFNKYSFNYELMPHVVSSDVSDTSISALGELNEAAGRAVNTEYGNIESGAYFEIVAHQLQEKFSFSPECEYIISEDYSWEKWIAILKEELDNGRPVLYSGATSVSKHAFICDGYDGEYFHINWGWDGNDNGYFDLSGILYSLSPSMVINIYPDRSEKVYARPYLCKDGLYTLFQDADFINVSVSNIQPGVKFDISSPTVHTPYRFSGQLGFALVDELGSIKEIFATSYIDGNGLQVYNPFMDGKDFICYNKTISEDISEGDRIQLVAKEASENDWKLVLGCSKIPSSISVNNCKSRLTTIYLDCDSNISLTLWDDPQNIITPTTENKLLKLFGSHEQCNFNVINDSYGYGLVTSRGKAAYGDMETIMCNKEKPGSFAFKLVDSEYYIEAKFYEYSSPLTVNVSSPGTLKNLIDKESALRMSDLTIMGSINAFDIWYIRENMKGLRRLDLSSAKIEGVSTPDIIINNFTVNQYQDDDAMPDWGISGLSLLTEIALPNGIKKLCNNSLGSLGIKKISLPQTIEDFGFNNFFACENLAIVENLNPNPVYIRDCNFTGTFCPTNGALIVAEASINSYKESITWKDFKKIYPLGTVLPEKISVAETDLKIVKGNSMQLPSVSFYPENTTIRDLTLSEYDENIISYNNGVITAVGIGTTSACLKGEFGCNSIMLNINVEECNLVSDIVLNETDATLNEGQTVQLTATVFPELADNRTLQWTSSNEAVATVDQSGLVTAISQGSAVITVSSTDGSNISATCKITVCNSSGIVDIIIDGEADVKIYNLTGLLLFEGKYSDAKLNEGIYIITTKDGRFKRLIK